MKRATAVLVAVLVVLAAIGAGAGTWRLVRDSGPRQPQISAYTNGHVIRAGPYLYCDVLDLNACEVPQEQGELAVNRDHPIQLSVDSVIGHAPWRLLRVYRDPDDTTTTLYRPNSTMAVTIPTTDPHRGPLQGIVVQLLTLVVDVSGQLFEVPHAEWSVQMMWD
ncbi:MAG: DUF2771 domain-containing protein [Mycobacterium sp.]